MSARVRQIESEIKIIQSELSADPERTGRDYEYRRDRGVSRAPIIREKLEFKRQQLSSARSKEAAIRAALRRLEPFSLSPAAGKRGLRRVMLAGT